MRLLTPPCLCLLLLAACGGDRVQNVQATVASADHVDSGVLRVRYQAVPSEGLIGSVAQRYGVDADPHTGVVLVALRRLDAVEERPLSGKVQARVTDLQGERQTVPLHEVRSGEYVDLVGSYRISPPNTYRFELDVEAAGQRQTVKFQRDF